MTKKLEDILNLPNVKDAFKEVDKKEKFTVEELSKYIQEKLLLTESINKSYVDIASDVLSDYWNTKDYNKVLQIIKNNEKTIKALIRNQHLTGLTAEASKVLSKRLSESDSAYIKALEAKFAEAQKEVTATDNEGNKETFDADDPNFPSTSSQDYKGPVSRFLDITPGESYRVISGALGQYQGERIWKLYDNNGTLLYTKTSSANWNPGDIQYIFTS